MSSILKALKKLEDEKAILKPDSLKIDAEILRGDASRRFSPTAILLLAIVLFVCGSGATYLFMKSGKGNTADMKSPASAAAPLIAPPSSPAVVPVTVEAERHNSQNESPVPAKVVSVETAPRLDNNTLANVRSPKPLMVNQSAKLVKQLEKRPAAPSRQEAVLVTGPAATVKMPALRVNGIAFQEESADRVAIVNGIYVTNGSLVEGAKVEDIQKDRVRFSFGGEGFDVTLGKSNR